MKSKIITIGILIVTITFSILFILNSLNLANKFDAPNRYTYQTKQDASYQVYLKPNDFISEEYLPQDKIYISDLVDHIKVDFKYGYDSQQSYPIAYTYDIIATLGIDYASNTMTSNANVYIKQYPILQNKFLNMDSSNSYTVEETAILDYSFYRSEVEKFKQNFAFPIKAYLKVDFVIKNSVELPVPIVDSSNMSVTIDMNSPVFTISKEAAGEQTKEAIKDGKKVGEVDKKELVIGLILFTAFLGVLFIMIRGYSKEIYHANHYQNLLSKLLKEHSDIIVELSHPMDIGTIRVIDVKNFEQLLDMEGEVRIPILLFEEKEIPQTTFLILYDGIAYRFILRESK